MKPKTEYAVLVQRDDGAARTWELLWCFKTTGDDAHAYRRALRDVRKAKPFTVHGGAAPFMLVIVPRGKPGDIHNWD